MLGNPSGFVILALEQDKRSDVDDREEPHREAAAFIAPGKIAEWILGSEAEDDEMRGADDEVRGPRIVETEWRGGRGMGCKGGYAGDSGPLSRHPGLDPGSSYRASAR